MAKTVLTLLISILMLTFCNAQQIEIKKVFGGYKYTQNGNKLTLSELSNVVKINTKSVELVKKGKTKMIFGSILAGIGGGLTGAPIGTAIGGGEPNWTLAVIGVGCMAIVIPIAISADKNIYEGVEHYNSSFNSAASNTAALEFKIIGNAQGIGLSMSF